MAIDSSKIKSFFNNHNNTIEELKKQKLLEMAAIAAKQLAEEEKLYQFDPFKKKSRATPTQQQVINDFVARKFTNYFVRGGNQSGKTNLAAYLVAHLLKEDLPGWSRLPQWGKQPLQILWAVRVGKHIEGSLWRKCKPFLTPGTFKEDRQGNQLQRIVMDNGNELIFIIYTNINSATDAAQSYTAHYVFIDETPQKAKLIEELQNRILINRGQLVMTFTPKRPVPEIKRIIESADPRHSMQYRLLTLDNPSLDNYSKELQVKKASQYGEKMQKAILEGEWIDAAENIFSLNEDKVIKEVPPHYNKKVWRHIESSDPAIGSGFGLIIAAEDPRTQLWYIILADELTGEDIECPSKAVATIKRYTKDLNIWKRFADPASLFYIQEAYKEGLKYSKALNKLTYDMWTTIEMVQELIGRRIFITPQSIKLFDQMMEITRSEKDPEKIINRKKYHMFDCLRYLVPMIPPLTIPEVGEGEGEDIPVDSNQFLKRVVFGKQQGYQPPKEKPLQKIRRISNKFWGR